MAKFTVRNVAAHLKRRLRVWPARHGRSLEAALLAGDPGRKLNLAEAVRRRFEPLGGVDLPPHPPVQVPEAPGFE